MGLVLYAVLVFFGLRGKPLRQAAPYCLVTALLLTVLGQGAVGEQSCAGVLCSRLVSSAGVLAMTLALGFLSFGIGAAVHGLLNRVRRM
jgi:hypothetical protein